MICIFVRLLFVIRTSEFQQYLHNIGPEILNRELLFYTKQKPYEENLLCPFHGNESLCFTLNVHRDRCVHRKFFGNAIGFLFSILHKH